MCCPLARQTHSLRGRTGRDVGPPQPRSLVGLVLGTFVFSFCQLETKLGKEARPSWWLPQGEPGTATTDQIREPLSCRRNGCKPSGSGVEGKRQLSARTGLPWILERKPCPTEEAACGRPLGVGGGEVRILGLVRDRETGGDKKREEMGGRDAVGHEAWGTDPQSNRKAMTR